MLPPWRWLCGLAAAMLCISLLAVLMVVCDASATTSFIHRASATGSSFRRARPAPGALGMSQPPGEAPPRFKLVAQDLMSVDKLTDVRNQRVLGKLPTLVPPPGAPNYVGLDELRQMVEGSMGWSAPILDLHKTEDSREFRVGPTAVSRFARGGKTRMLTEIGLLLQERKIPTLFITFSDFTEMEDGERDSINPLESILMRIAWATAPEETVAKVVAHARETFSDMEDKTVHDFTFPDWLETASISEGEIKKWLGQSQLILLVDELNQLLTTDLLDSLVSIETDEATMGKQRVAAKAAEFLRLVFLKEEGRYLIFSSHVATVGSRLEDYWLLIKRGRRVVKLRIPVINELADAQAITRCTHGGQISWTGRAPSLLYELFKRSPTCESTDLEGVRRLFSGASTPMDADIARAIIRSALDGDPNWVAALGALAGNVDAFGESIVWPPCYLGTACDLLSNTENDAIQSALGGAFISGVGRVEPLLKELLEDKGSG
ncbi:unnamed protein product [Vitrella brassicaformis CCMP3155]|uniref:ATPase AAA-type core domain-containing protein n=1 Tax=Vitrella brassicaformis (strain CCMP3155) TaxID=1169540 RepID=A0A0G4EB74_VITBC|nr:unnamed protein product [Vitrella brassicaformis CCMP3155]|mmetsp:Transcript_7790/g.22161  ORF Transcript_7790/g.22161 Transcript_7790/m.22161 type:complete len:492 (+) Transcript_7790:143-1618(+)|eukprot:CEL92505.1 unnamed protein product [Vitrella brassicaformis CCMP3155]